MAGGMRKGGPFEREVCRLLSNWWTDGDADDCFWRSSGSGARATSRGKKGKATTGHRGDITCASADAQPLTDLILFELKRGYSRHTIADLLDAPPKAKEQTYEGWFRKAELSAFAAQVPYWMVIVRRDRRETLCFFPDLLMAEFDKYGEGWSPLATFEVIDGIEPFVCVRFADFLARVSPENVRAISELRNPQKRRA